jgi:hypothetical protein
MGSAAAPTTANAAEAAPATAPAAASEAVAAAPAAPTPVQTSNIQGCALAFVQGNSSYSMFQQILNAAPSTSNYSSESQSWHGSIQHQKVFPSLTTGFLPLAVAYGSCFHARLFRMWLAGIVEASLIHWWLLLAKSCFVRAYCRHPQ